MKTKEERIARSEAEAMNKNTVELNEQETAWVAGGTTDEFFKRKESAGEKKEERDMATDTDGRNVWNDMTDGSTAGFWAAFGYLFGWVF